MEFQDLYPHRIAFLALMNLKTIFDLNTSYKILKLSKDYLLFSVKNNLIVFDRRNKECNLIELPTSIRENYVTDIVQISEGKYWLSTNVDGILELNTETFEIKETSILDGKSTRCFLKNDDKLYIGTTEGLFIYNLLTHKLTITSLYRSS